MRINLLTMTHYRYEYTQYHTGHIQISLNEYAVLRETDKGYWIVPEWYKNYPTELKEKQKKWVPKKSKKRFAYSDKDKALTNLIKRTERRKELLKAQLTTTERVLREIERKFET